MSRRSLAPLDTNGRVSLRPARALAPQKRQTLEGGGGSSGARRMSSMSTGGMRRSSAYGRGPGKAKDPRDVTSKAFQMSAKRTLVSYLIDHGYDQPISPKILTAPTTREFLSVFTFLYRQLDPSFVFGPRYEEEVPMLFKRLKYPFPLSRHAMQAVGTPHTWPHVLAALAWLVDLLMYQEIAEEDRGTQAWDDSRSFGAMFFEHMTVAYEEFLSGVDNYDEVTTRLRAWFDENDASTRAEITKLEAENASVSKQVSDATSGPSQLEKLRAQKGDFESDVAKFDDLLDKLRAHHTLLDKHMRELSADMKAKDAELESLQEQKYALQRRVDAQPMSSAEVQKMVARRTKLEELLAYTKGERSIADAKVSTFKSEVHDAETRLGARVDSYNRAVDTLGLGDCRLQINDGTTTMNLKLDVKPALVKFKESTLQRIRRHQLELANLQNNVDVAEETLDDRREQLSQLQGRLRMLENTYTDEKETLAQHVGELNREVESIQSKMYAMRIDGNVATEYEDAQAELAAAIQEHSRLQAVHAREKQIVRDAVLETVTKLADYKAHIEARLSRTQRAFTAQREMVQS